MRVFEMEEGLCPGADHWVTFHFGSVGVESLDYFYSKILTKQHYLKGPLVIPSVDGLKALKSPLVLLVKVSPTLLALLLLRLSLVLLLTNLVLKSSTTIPTSS
jgi:hypothetical protein